MKVLCIFCFILFQLFSYSIFASGRDYSNYYAKDCVNPPLPVEEINYIYNSYILPDILNMPNFDQNISPFDNAYIDEEDDRWHVSYKFADFDNTGEKNYIVYLFYTSFEGGVLVVCKKEDNHWELVWKVSTYVVGAGCVSLKDIDNNGIEEIIITGGNFKSGFLDIYKRVDGDFIWLTENNAFYGNEGVSLVDEDGDGIYEVIVSPSYQIFPFDIDPETGEPDVIYNHGYQRFKLINGQYQLVAEWDSRRGSGAVNPSLGVVHPGEIPISEILTVPDEDRGKGQDSGEAFRIFIGGLGEAKLVKVDWSNVKVFDSIPVTHVKLWENRHQDKGVIGTGGFMGIGFNLKSYPNKNRFTIQPSDPALPCMNLYPGFGCHFIGRYVEVKANKKALLRKMKDEIIGGKFNQEKDTIMFIPYRGKLTDGSLFSGTAFLVIQPNWEKRQRGKEEEDSEKQEIRTKQKEEIEQRLKELRKSS